MRSWKMGLAAVAAAGAVAAGLAATVGAAGPLYAGKLYGNIPNVTVRGVAAGAAPWIVKGKATVTTTKIVVKGTDLVVPPGYMGTGKPVPKTLVNTTVGVPSVGAELTCAQGTSVLTVTAPLSKKGAFDIRATVKVPSTCTDPIVLIGPVAKGKMVAWFASTDFLTYGLPGKSTVGWGGKTSGKSGGKTSKWA